MIDDVPNLEHLVALERRGLRSLDRVIRGSREDQAVGQHSLHPTCAAHGEGRPVAFRRHDRRRRRDARDRDDVFESGIAPLDPPTPEPAPNELLVRLHASSINRIDALVAAGWLKGMMEHEFPVVPGRDFAGVVERTGAEVSRFAAGDAVFGFLGRPVLHDGAWAEYLVAPEGTFVAAKPRSLDFVQAAALPLAGITALMAVDAVEPESGSTVLVAGASGGVGTYAVQLAARSGATVIATARPDAPPAAPARRRRRRRPYYTSGGVASAVRALHPDGIDALIDVVNQAERVRSARRARA